MFPKHAWLFKIPLLTGLILNLAIAAVLAYYVFLGGGGTPKSKPTLRRCLLFSIESGLITCLFMLIIVVTSYIKTPNLIWIAVQFIVTKTNSNSILLTLNSRLVVNTEMRSPTANTRSHLRNLHFSNRMPAHNLAIAKTQVTETTGEEGYNGAGSWSSQLDSNEICLVELSENGKPKGSAWPSRHSH